MLNGKATDIRLKITVDKFDENFSIEEWLNFSKMTNQQLYEKMLLFVTDEQGDYLDIEKARAVFNRLPKKEWGECITKFTQAVRDAYVSPMNGGS